jgi:hypothetical protein
MILSGVFTIASEQHSGLAAEQILFNRGFHELGRRTYATAWTPKDTEVGEVIRLSADSRGSEAYFGLAQKMEGNPYMPIVFNHAIMPSNDHIAHVEKLENPAQKQFYPRFKEIRQNLAEGNSVSEADVRWYEEMKYMALRTDAMSNFFMNKGFFMDIDSLPEPTAFKEAAIAITNLSMRMYEFNSRYVPVPDMNHTNIMWRRTESGLHPVLYDSVAMSMESKHEDLKHVPSVRAKLGMPALNA